MNAPWLAVTWALASACAGLAWQWGPAPPLGLVAAWALLPGAVSGSLAAAARGGGPADLLAWVWAAVLSLCGPVAAVAVVATGAGAGPVLPGVGQAAAASVGALAGVGLALRASGPCAGYDGRRSPTAGVVMAPREVAPCCGVCRAPAPLDATRTVRCGGRRDDGRACVGVYHRDHVASLKDGTCEYCNQPFQAIDGGAG